MKIHIIAIIALLHFGLACFAGDKPLFTVGSPYGGNWYVASVTDKDLAQAPGWNGETNSLPVSRRIKCRGLREAESKNALGWTVAQTYLKPLGLNRWVYLIELSTPEDKIPRPSGFIPPVDVLALLNGHVVPAVIDNKYELWTGPIQTSETRSV